MYTLMSGLWRYYTSLDQYYVLIVGLDNAGKTTLLEKFKGLHKKSYVGIPLSKITPTVGLNVGRVDTEGVRLVFWDLGGQSELHSIWEKYYSKAHGVIFVIDSSDRSRLRDSKLAFDRMIENKELEGVPLLVVCNKQDVEGAMSVQEVKAVFNESAYKLGMRDCKVENTSAVSGTNLSTGLEWIAHCVKRNKARPPVQAET